MKRITLFIVAFLLIGSISAWADEATINFESQLGGGLKDVGPDSAGSTNCVTSSSGADLCGPAAFYIDFTQGPSISETDTPCGDGSPFISPCSVQDQYGAGGALTISYNGATIPGLTNPIPPGTIITAYTTGGSGSQDFDSDGDTHTNANIVVTYIDPAFLSDVISGTAPSDWTGFAIGDTVDPSFLMDADLSVVLTDPLPSPAPEPGTLILLGIGVAAMTLGFGWRSCSKRHACARLTP